MLAWITGNLSTIIICAVLCTAVALIVLSMVRGKRKGKSPCGCGCGCGGCAMKESCHKK